MLLKNLSISLLFFQPYPPIASLNKSSLWFGSTNITNDTTTSPFQTFQLTNHSKGKISVTWIMSKVILQSQLFSSISHFFRFK